jgi:hypothetical protein
MCQLSHQLSFFSFFYGLTSLGMNDLRDKLIPIDLVLLDGSSTA